MKIDPKSIDNAAIPHAVMTQVIPAINELNDRIARLEAGAVSAAPAEEPKPTPKRTRSKRKTTQ